MKKTLLFTILMCCSFILYPQVPSLEEMDILEKLDLISTAIEERSNDLIEMIYDYDKSDPDYNSLIEILVEKAGDLVFQEEYDYAFRIIEGVLYNNLTHVQAQELYLILDEILKERAEAEAEKERLRLEAEAEAERQRIAAEEEAERLRLEAEAEQERLRLAEEERIKREQEEETRRQEEEAARQAEQEAREAEFQEALKEREAIIAEAEAYEESIRTVDVRNFNFYTLLFPADFLYYTSEVNTLYKSGEKTENILYGLAVQAGVFFDHPFINLNFDMNLDFGLAQISDYSSKNINYNAALSIGTPAIFVPICFRFGFIYNRYLYDDLNKTDMAVTNFPSLSLGAGFNNIIFLDRIKFSLSFDYYLVSVMVDHIDSAFGGNISIAYKFYTTDKFDLYTGISSEVLLVNQAGMYETNVNGKLGIGISFNE